MDSVSNLHVYMISILLIKSLSPQAMTLMEYLIKTGSERVAQQCRENIYAVQTLKDFQYIDRDGKDQVHKHSHVLRAPCICQTE